MDTQDTTVAVKILYVLTWALLASYYFVWGTNEPCVAATSVDESGWIPDGTFASEIIEETTMERERI